MMLILNFLVTHLLNNASSKRTIPKQECMVLLSGLPLVSCTEKIETVSISGYNKVSKKDSNTIITRYRNRPTKMHHLSLHEYFFETHKNKPEKYIPHYVGSSTTPKFPITESYARCMLILHKPWSGSSRQITGGKLEEFLEFLGSSKCPQSVKLACARAEERYKTGGKSHEPTAEHEESGGCYGIDEIDDETRHMMEFLTTINRAASPDGMSEVPSFHRGLDYDWGKKQIPQRDPEKQDGSWLNDKIRDYQFNTQDASDLRVDDDYTIEGCNDSQNEAMMVILQKLREYMNFHKDPNNRGKKFTPLRMTIMGEAGTGKSHLIKTITSVVRKIFNENDAVHIVGPTGKDSNTYRKQCNMKAYILTLSLLKTMTSNSTSHKS